jgi:hypothetical protein
VSSSSITARNVLGKREQAERVTSGRSVENDALPLTVIGEIGQREQRHGLVDARKRRVDETLNVLAIEVRAAIDDGRERLTPSRDEVAARRSGVELAGKEIRNGRHGRRSASERSAEDVGECARRVGRKHERRHAGPRAAHA